MKNNAFRIASASIIIFGICLGLAFPVIAINQYNITDLGSDKYLVAINNEGQATGSIFSNNNIFIYENGIITELGSIGGMQPNDINDSGQIVGYYYFDADNNGAFIWDNGTFVDLGSFSGEPAIAYAINNNAQIAVSGNGAFLYDYENEVITPLDMLGGTTVLALGINNHGHVVGFTNAGGAYLYENGNMRLIGTFPNRTRPNTTRDINDFGQVVGFYDNGSAYVPFLWENEITTYLPSIYERDTRPHAINNSGQIVGKGNVESGEARGLLWENEMVYDLTDLLLSGSDWIIQDAVDINDAGVIVGRAKINGIEHAVILTPILEDTDGDGIPDDQDACPFSDLSETVVIDGWDSGVDNVLLEDGCTISDLISQCADDADNHGEFVSSVSHTTNPLKKKKIISGKEKGMIQKCAAKSDIP